MGKKHKPNIPRPSVEENALVPPINPPIGDESTGWFYDDDAGGFILNFGKYRGQRMHDVPFGYIAWFLSEFSSTSSQMPVLNAARQYMEGLEEYMRTNYGEFRVPLGRCYRGTRIRQVRNRRWMRFIINWIRRRGPHMEREYGLFVSAVEIWLDHPNHQEVRRDIGERTDIDSDDPDALPESEWELDVAGEDNESDRREFYRTEERDFIDNSGMTEMELRPNADYRPSEDEDATDATSEETEELEDTEEEAEETENTDETEEIDFEEEGVVGDEDGEETEDAPMDDDDDIQ